MTQDDIWGKPLDQATATRAFGHATEAKKLARRASAQATIALICALLALAVAIWR